MATSTSWGQEVITCDLCPAKFDELEREAEKHRKLWHQEVDIIFNKLNSMIKSTRENHLTSLKSQQSKIKNLNPDMTQNLEVNSYKPQLAEYRDIPADIDVEIPLLKTNTVQGRELSIAFGEYKATLTQTALSSLTDEVYHLSITGLLDKARVIATIPDRGKPDTVACVGKDEAWICGRSNKNVLRRVDIHGSVPECICTECQLGPSGISVTRQGELIYSDCMTNTLHVVRSGKTEVLLTLLRGWSPWGLCCTRSGDILVYVKINDQNIILRLQGKILKQEIYRDEHGNPIFGEGYRMLYQAENNNGDICVSDCNADIVVVLDKTGRVRFRYDGKPAMRERPFSPKDIVTDSNSQIIVADYVNACLHILDQDGHFLKCVDNCGLKKPKGLSVDSEGRLWVALYDSGKIKVIQYMK